MLYRSIPACVGSLMTRSSAGFSTAILPLSTTLAIVLLALATPASAWDNLLQDPGFERYHWHEGIGSYVPDQDAAWTEIGIGRSSVVFDASSWTAPPDMTAERPLGFSPGTTGYEGTAAIQNSGAILLQQDIIHPAIAAGGQFEAWVWLGGAGLDNNTAIDNKEEEGGWDIYFYGDPNPANWNTGNALEHHVVYMDYPGAAQGFTRVSGFGRIPTNAVGVRFQARCHAWYKGGSAGNYGTQVAIDNAHFAVVRAPNLLVNGNFELDTPSSRFVAWNRPAAWPFPNNTQNPPIDLRNTYGDNIDWGTFRPYWGGSHAYGYETYVYGAWIYDGFSFSQTVNLTQPPGTPLTYNYWWLQDTAQSSKRAQLRNVGGRITSVIEYLNSGNSLISQQTFVENWPVGSHPANTCISDTNAGKPFNPYYRLVPPAGAAQVRVNVHVLTRLNYDPNLALTAHLVDDFYLGYTQLPDTVTNVSVTDINCYTARVRWTTTDIRPSVLDYGETTAYGLTATDSYPRLSHNVLLTGLTPGRKYYFRITGGTATHPVVPSQAVNVFFTTERCADFDADGDVDQADFGACQRCITGNTIPQNDPACRPARIDGDDDVDSIDIGILRNCLSGEGIPIDPACYGM